MKLKKGDKAILLVILIFFLLSTALTFYNKNGSDNKEALIEVEGKVIKKIKLSQDMEKEEFHLKIDDTKFFYVIAEEGKIKMEQSTCPNQICVKTGEISEVGESIICLPYKTGIYIEEVGGEEY